MTIAKRFETLKQAETFQNQLYSRYESVKLLRSPWFPMESGLYIWDVSYAGKRPYQPKTGAKCSCKPGIQRDNCPNCEGTGMVIDFAAIRARVH